MRIDMGAIYLMNDIGMKDHCSSPKVGTTAFRLRKISDSIHDEDKYKEYIDELYADVFSNLEQLAKSGATCADMPEGYFRDRLRAINPLIPVHVIDKVAGEVLERLSSDGFSVWHSFTFYDIQW